MKSLTTLAVLVAIATIAVTVFASAVQAQAGYMLAGRWNTPEGGQIEIGRTGTHVTATFISGGDCPFGEKRTIYFEAEVTGTSCSGILDRECKDVLKGSMERCTMSEELHKQCNLPAVYTAYFEAKGSTETIEVTWKNEHYSQNTDNKKDTSAGQNQCRWTRDPSGDTKINFNLTRWHSPLRGGKKCMGKKCG